MQSSYVCELVHCVREPQLHDALRPHAPPSRDDAQLDDDDERRRDDERRLSDDAPAPDASVIAPSQSSSRFVIGDRTISLQPRFAADQIRSIAPKSSSDCNNTSGNSIVFATGTATRP